MPNKFDQYFNNFIAKPLRTIGLFNYAYLEATSSKNMDEVQEALNLFITQNLGYQLDKDMPVVGNRPFKNTRYIKKSGRTKFSLDTTVATEQNGTKITIVASLNQYKGFYFGKYNFEVISAVSDFLRQGLLAEVTYTNH